MIKEISSNLKNKLFGPKFQEVAEMWMECNKNEFAPSTYAAHLSALQSRIFPALGNIRVKRLSVKDVDLFISGLKGSKRLNSRGILSPNTIARFNRIIRTILNFAIKWEYIKSNVARKVKTPEIKRPPKSFTVEELLILFNKAEELSSRKRLIVFFAALTGMRRSEMLGLSWDKLKMEERQIRVEQSLVYAQGQLTLGNPKSETSNRIITAPNLLMDQLIRWRTEQRKLFAEVNKIWTEETFIFEDINGNILNPSHITTWFPKWVISLGLPRLNLHCLRKTYGILLLENSVDLKTVSTVLGHADLKVTSDHYVRTTDKMRNNAADTMDKLLYKNLIHPL